MKRLSVLLCTLVVVVGITVFSILPSKVFSATVGDQLLSAENGWTRYETTGGPYDSYFSYTGTNWIQSTNPGYYSGDSMKYTMTLNDSVSFSFTGTRFRIIAELHVTLRSNYIEVTIDGTTYSYSEATKNLPQAICFDSINSVTLENGIHQVTIINKTYNNRCEVDAIDILGSLNNPAGPDPTPTPAPTPTVAPDLCYNTEIVGSLGSYNPGAVSNNSQATISFTVVGAQLGDFVQVSFDQNLQGIALYGYVSATNQVTIVFQNSTGNSITLTPGIVRIRITRHVKE